MAARTNDFPPSAPIRYFASISSEGPILVARHADLDCDSLRVLNQRNRHRARSEVDTGMIRCPFPEQALEHRLVELTLRGMACAARQRLRGREQAVVHTEVPAAGVEQGLRLERVTDPEAIHDAERLIGDADRPREVAWRRLRLDHRDARTPVGEPQCGGQAHRPAADHDDVADVARVTHAARSPRTPPAFVLANCTSS